MKSKFLALLFAATFGAAVTVTPGCSGSDGNSEELVEELFILLDNLVETVIQLLEDTTGLELDALEDVLENLLGLEDGGLVGLEELLNNGELDDLLAIGEGDEGVGGLLDILEDLLGG